ncbi:hypothetical protein EGW08_016895, partial [Elysia chlorotica]
FLHLDSPLSSVSIYFTFSKFDSQELKNAYDTLKTRDVIVKLKRFEKERTGVVSNAAVLNSHKCKKVYQEAMKPLVPATFFSNIGSVVRLLQTASSTATPTSPASTTVPPVSHVQLDTGQARPEDCPSE